MISFFSSLILLAFAISALSAPLTETQDTVLPTFTESIPPAAETELVTFGDLTIPSQGGTFNDFIVGPEKESSTTLVTPQLSSRFFKFRTYVRRGGSELGFLGAIFGGGDCRHDGNCFEAKGPGGGKPIPGGSKLKPGSPHKADTVAPNGH